VSLLIFDGTRRWRRLAGTVAVGTLLMVPVLPPEASGSAGVPSTPSDLSAVAANGSATIAFRVTDLGGSAITDVQYRVDSSSETDWRSFGWLNETALDPTTPARTHYVYTVDGLRNGRDQIVDLRVVNAQGPSDHQSITVRPRITTAVGTQGEDFWFAFLDHASKSGTAVVLSMFVAVSEDTNVTLMGSALPGGSITTKVLASEGIKEIRIASGAGNGNNWMSRLRARPIGQRLDGQFRMRSVEDRSLRLVADLPVAAYGLNLWPGTTDAYVLIPTAGLGQRYRAASLWSIHGTNFDSDLSAATVVAATRNDTTVTLSNIPVGTNIPGGVLGPDDPDSVTVTLQAGQTFSYREPGQRRASDLRFSNVSGRLIVADKPIAVFSGNERTVTPPARHFPPVFNVSGDEIEVAPSPAGATDHAVSQLAPTNAWGSEFIAVRYPRTNALGDLVLIVADSDGTEVTIDGEMATTLDAGEFEIFRVLPKPAEGLFAGATIRTSRPAQAFQYLTMGAYPFAGDNRNADADPAMALLPPTEQFLRDYTLTPVSTNFVFHAVNVVIPSASVPSFRINGTAPDGSGAIAGIASNATFQPIGTSGFSGAQIHLLDDTLAYRFTADRDFGVFLYGGRANDGYATPGGFAVRNLDAVRAAAANPPAVVEGVRVVCEADPLETCLAATCNISGGDPDIDILWRASTDGVPFAGEGARLDEAGRGSFTFSPSGVPIGGIVDVELVEWGASDSFTVTGCIPRSVPAGEGGAVPGWLVVLGLLALVGLSAVRRQAVIG
jgi:hypothetical protein